MDDQPIEIRVTRQATRLELEWDDGAVTWLNAADLRRRCRCAECYSVSRRTGPPAQGHDGVRITAVEPMGVNSVNLHFSDGHIRGIFPFPYLRSLRSGGAA